MDERRTERIVVQWLEEQGYDVKRSRSRTGPPNLAAASPRGKIWLVQIRGETGSERGDRQEWFNGVGKLACAMSDKVDRYSLAVPQGYRQIIEEFLPGLTRTLGSRFGVLLVRPTAVQQLPGRQATTRRSRRVAPASSPAAGGEAASGAPAGQGHPDGVFVLKGYRYKVDGGKLAGVRHPYGEPLSIRSFAGLARELRLKLGSQSATRVIDRARRAAEPGGPG